MDSSKGDLVTLNYKWRAFPITRTRDLRNKFDFNEIFRICLLTLNFFIRHVSKALLQSFWNSGTQGLLGQISQGWTLGRCLEVKPVACGLRGHDCSFALGNARAPALRAGSTLVLCGCPSHVPNMYKLPPYSFRVVQVLGFKDPNLPDLSILIVEGGMARVSNKASDLSTCRVFQNNVSKFLHSFAGDEQSQVP